jgi:hypothetical protein
VLDANRIKRAFHRASSPEAPNAILSRLFRFGKIRLLNEHPLSSNIADDATVGTEAFCPGRFYFLHWLKNNVINDDKQ